MEKQAKRATPAQAEYESLILFNQYQGSSPVLCIKHQNNKLCRSRMLLSGTQRLWGS